jgi:periplasmic copper chaperone A
MKRTRLAAVAVALGALAVPAMAQGHVFLEQTEEPADGYPILDFVVPHGCDGSPTTRLTVQFPESVPSVTPEAVPGWEITTKEGPKDEVELFGETVTEGISEVTWTATGEPLADDQLLRFGAEAKLPATEGETVYFPTIQKCEQGQTRWIQIPAEGEDPESLEEPAPALPLVAPAGDEHGGMSDAEGEDAAAQGEEASAAASEDNDDNGLAVAALVVGGLGLLTGGASLMRRRNGA